MPRFPLITSTDELDADGRRAFERIVASRGEVSRPFSVLLHAPALAAAIAEVGHVVRFESRLADADRELVTIATGRAQGCAFVVDSHRDAARAAGVDPDALAEPGDDGGSADRRRVLVSFVDEACAGAVSDETFGAAVELVGVAGVVELAATVGYYSMLSVVMRATEAC